MLQTEYVKNLQSNYERFRLPENTEENRYQYKVVKRGGIGGLLPCDIRYINGDSWLYYDITSRQPVTNMLRRKNIDRQWVRDFLWNLKRIRLEVSRFLLDEGNVIWYPEQVYQSVNDTVFEYIYVPYWNGDNGFLKFLDFVVERMDYRDQELVDFVYSMYEKYTSFGEGYLAEQIFEDARVLEEKEDPEPVSIPESSSLSPADSHFDSDRDEMEAWLRDDPEEVPERKGKRGLLAFLSSARKKDARLREKYLREQELAMEGYSVAEETSYGYDEMDEPEEEDERTVFIETHRDPGAQGHKLLTERGEVLAELVEDSVLIGKKAGEVDVVLTDPTVSRIHARIFREGEEWYLEDMNSTNGSAKNRVPMAPCEKRKLQREDEITLGAVTLVFR